MPKFISLFHRKAWKFQGLLLLVFFVLISSPPASAIDADGVIVWEQSENIHAYWDYPFGSAIDGSALYVVGYASPVQYQPDWRIEKRNLNTGALIWGQTIANSNVAWDVVVDATAMYIAGDDLAPGNVQWRMEKRDLASGALLWSKLTNPSGGIDRALAVARDAAGVYFACYEAIEGGRFHIEKRNPADGTVIWSVTQNYSADIDTPTAMAIDASGVYIVGYGRVSGGDWRWIMEKRDLTIGALIWSKTANFSTGPDYANGVAVDATGVYVVGFDQTIALGRYQWRMEKRNLATGDVIWSKTSYYGFSDEAYGVTVDANGVYVVGYDRSPMSVSPWDDFQWRMEKRDLSTGDLMWTQTYNHAGKDEDPRSVEVDASGMYVIGRTAVGVNDSQWRIEKRVWYVDCGLRIFDGTENVVIGCEPEGVSVVNQSPLKMGKNGVPRGIGLLNTRNPSASKIRIKVPEGTKSLATF